VCAVWVTTPEANFKIQQNSDDRSKHATAHLRPDWHSTIILMKTHLQLLITTFCAAALLFKGAALAQTPSPSVPPLIAGGSVLWLALSYLY
jgi:hypothetical protein